MGSGGPYSFVFLIDKRSRDLPVAAAVGDQLAAWGHRIRIGHEAPRWQAGGSDFWEEAAEDCDVLVVPAYNVARTPHLLAWKFKTQALLVLAHSEQIIGADSFADKLGTTARRAYRRDVDAHLVWGPHLAHLLLRERVAEPRDILICGYPRAQLAVNLRERNDLAQRYAVGFVSNFVIAHWSEREFESMARRYGWGDLMRRKRDLYSAAFDEFLKCIVEFATSSPEQDFLVRLHPGEDAAAFHSVMAFPNIHLDAGDRPFPSVLSQCERIVQYTSTSYFESILATVPTYPIEFSGLGWPGNERHIDFMVTWDREEFPRSWDELSQLDQGHQSLEMARRGLEELFSLSHGDPIVRSAAGLLHLATTRPRAEPLLRDRFRTGRFHVEHAMKHLAGRLGYLAQRKLRIRNALGKRVIAAERAYWEGPDRVTQQDLDRAFASVSTPDISLDEVRFNLTEMGLVAVAPDSAYPIRTPLRNDGP